MLYVSRLDRENVVVEQFDHIEDVHVYDKAWIDVVNPTEEELLAIAKEFQFHPVTKEDVLGARVRVKIEEFDAHTYVVLRGVSETSRFGFEQLNFIISDTVLLTISLYPRKYFSLLREDEKKLLSLLSEGVGVEYLFHHLVDFEIDSYFKYFDRIYKEIDAFEYGELPANDAMGLEPLYKTKKHLVDAKKSVAGLRDSMRILAERRVQFIDSAIMVYFRDIYDHLILLSEMSDGYRDLINSSLELQLAASSQKTNDIVKILTIVTTMFMPLTFITGLYGMNFRFMPEIYSRWGYPVVLLVMILIELLMLVYFKKKKWI